MQTHRFYLPPERCAGAVLRLDGSEAYHALHVLRLKRGDEAVVLDGVGNRYRCTVESAVHESVSLRMIEKESQPPPPCSITLLVAIPKGKIIEDIIEKSVELGVQQIVPLLTERVVTRLDEDDAIRKRDKWQQAAIEAIKQCGAVWLPKIETPTPIATVLGHQASAPSLAFSLQPSAFEISLVGSLQTERRHPKEIFREFEKKNRRAPKTAAVWIGPEGDFTLEELRAIEATGAQPITLGNLTLRVETAAIYCLSLLNYELNSR